MSYSEFMCWVSSCILKWCSNSWKDKGVVPEIKKYSWKGNHKTFIPPSFGGGKKKWKYMTLRKQMNTQGKTIGCILCWTNGDIKWSIWHAAQSSITLIQAVELRQDNQLQVKFTCRLWWKPLNHNSSLSLSIPCPKFGLTGESYNFTTSVLGEKKMFSLKYIFYI